MIDLEALKTIKFLHLAALFFFCPPTLWGHADVWNKFEQYLPSYGTKIE